MIKNKNKKYEKTHRIIILRKRNQLEHKSNHGKKQRSERQSSCMLEKNNHEIFGAFEGR
jgi:hypothetical protein